VGRIRLAKFGPVCGPRQVCGKSQCDIDGARSYDYSHRQNFHASDHATKLGMHTSHARSTTPSHES
jgi:hypothetical protein